MVNLNDYAEIVGKEIIDGLYVIAEKLKDKMMQHINSTAGRRRCGRNIDKNDSPFKTT